MKYSMKYIHIVGPLSSYRNGSFRTPHFCLEQESLRLSRAPAAASYSPSKFELLVPSIPYLSVTPELQTSVLDLFALDFPLFCQLSLVLIMHFLDLMPDIVMCFLPSALFVLLFSPPAPRPLFKTYSQVKSKSLLPSQPQSPAD